MDYLFVIPARGGSKRIPRKNIRPLNGKPLIHYSIDVARSLARDEDICVTTEDDEVIKIVEEYGLHVPFKRPTELAADEAGTHDVLLHTVNFFQAMHKLYDAVVLLQPTSPLRTRQDVLNAIGKFNKDIDMVVSVRESHCASVLCRENNLGYLEFVMAALRRKDSRATDFYEYNGAIYVINIESLMHQHLHSFQKVVKSVMLYSHSIDIDTEVDWQLAELLCK